jgi:hypothetical protein
MSLTSTPSLEAPYDAFMLLPCFDIMEMIGKEVVKKRLDLDREFWMEIRSQVSPPRTCSRWPPRSYSMTAVERIMFHGDDHLEYVREFERFEEDNPPPEEYAWFVGHPGTGSFIEYCFSGTTDFERGEWCSFVKSDWCSFVKNSLSSSPRNGIVS